MIPATIRTAFHFGRSSRYAAAAALLCACAASQLGCQGSSSSEDIQIVVPSTATTAPQYQGDGSFANEHYVIRMSDGRRDWEVSFPSGASGYQMRIPLEGDEPDAETVDMNWTDQDLTEADKELIEEMRRQNPDMEREGVFIDGEHINDRQARREGGDDAQEGDDTSVDAAENVSQKRDETQPAPTRPSYLKGVAHIQNLYERGKYELAMARLSQLEKAYPDDVRLLSMKGSLWVKLGRNQLARRAWERVLQLEPDNEQIADALENLD